MAHYGAAKAAINHLTETLAVELAPDGIRVLAVAPGTTLTPGRRGRALRRAGRGRWSTRTRSDGSASPTTSAGSSSPWSSDLGRSVTGQVVFGDNGAQLSRNRPAL